MKAIIRSRVVQHLLFWCFYFLMYFFTFRAKEESVYLAFVTAAVSLPYQLVFTYSQLAFLIPRFLLKRKIFLFIVLSLVSAKIAINLSILTYRYIVIPLETGNPPMIPWDWL